MADVHLYLVEIENDKAEATKIAQRTAQRLESKELKLLQLIESLGEYLNNDKPITRERAMSYLAEVIAETPNGVFSLQHRRLLFDFILSRLADHEVGIGSCAKGMLALEERGRWDSEQVSKVMSALLEDSPQLVQRGSQSQRYPVLLLLDLLMAKYREAMSSLHENNPEFLRQFIYLFEGEKDPRNLMVVFSILAVIMTEWDISSSVQEVFDAAFNYFPITFRPPPEDTYKITANDLKERLKACIASTPAFAPYAFPALLDKLDSTALNTKASLLSNVCGIANMKKRDVLKALEASVVNYGSKTVALYSITLWDAVKFEILQVQEDELAQESLKVLVAIGKILSSGSQQGLMEYLKPIVKECNEHLEDAPTKQSDAACRILTAVASSSSYACNAIMSGVFPHLFTLFQTSDNIPKRRGLVQVLRNILQVDCETFGDWQHIPLNLSVNDVKPQTMHLPENGVHQFSKQILSSLKESLISTPIKEVSFRLILLDTCLQLVKIREILNDEEISQIVKLFNNIIINEESYTKDDAKVASMSALLEIAHQKPQIIIDITFPALLSKLPDGDVGVTQKFVPVLEAFAKISVEDRVFATSLIRLKHRLSSAVQQKSSAQYVQAILFAILYSFQHVNSMLLDGNTSPSPYHDLVLPLLTQICPNLSLEQNDDLTFALIGKIANEVLRIQPIAFQNTFASQIYTMTTGLRNEESAPFSTDRSVQRTRHLLVSLYLLAALRRDIQFPFKPHELLDALVSVVSASEPSMSIKAASLLQISLVVNKFIPASDLGSVLGPFIQSNLETSAGSNLSFDSIRVGFAILKGLVLRNASLLKDMFSILLKALSDPSTGHFVAQGFSTLLEPEEVLSRENHCSISALHKQKTFAIAVPAIIEGFRKGSTVVKKNHLIALSGILQWLDYSAFESEVSSITPLLLQTLEISGEDEIKTGAIDKITAILAENPRIIEEHASSVITRLLNLANPSIQKNPPAVRAKALQCLSLLAEKLRLEVILPFQKQVVKKLIQSLDDSRRAVRTEAVKCRTKWINLDDNAKEEDEE